MQMFLRWTARLLLTGLLLLSGAAGAQTNFSVNATGVVKGGVWVVQNGGGHNAITFSGLDRQLDFVVVGTSCVLENYYAVASLMTITVRDADSGAVQVATNTPSTATGGWQTNLTLFSGLADSRHWVTLHFGAQYLIDSDNTFLVSGAAPNVVLPVTFGPVTTLPGAGVAAHLLVTNMYIQATSHLTYYHGDYTDGEIWFYATGDSLWARTNSNLCNLRLINVDTGNAYTVTEGNTGMEWIKLASGQGTARHLYRLSASCDPRSGQTFSVEQIMTDAATAGSGLDLTTTIPTRPTITVFGDSITVGVAGATYSWLAYGRLIAEAKNYALNNLGVGQSPVNNASGGPAPGETTARCNAVIATAPTYCIILYGTNDITSNVTVSNFQASYKSMCDQLAAGLPTTKFIVLSILPSNYGNRLQSQADPYNAAISTVVATEGSHWQFVDTKPWNMAGSAYANGGALNTFVTTNFFDGLHPNATGYSLMEGFIAPYVTAYVAPHFRRGSGGRGGSRSDVGYNTYGLSQEVQRLCFAQ